MNSIKKIISKVKMYYVYFRYGVTQTAIVGQSVKLSRQARIGEYVELLNNVTILNNVTLGHCTSVNTNTRIDSGVIGSYCSIGADCHIGGGNHSINSITTSQLALKVLSIKSTFDPWAAPPIIGDDVWVAAKCIIMQGVNIGQGAIVGAGSIVTRDVPPYAIVVGNPAKIVRYRFNEEVVDRLLSNSIWKKLPQDLSSEDKALIMKHDKWQCEV